jgi:hypothetical protein
VEEALRRWIRDQVREDLEYQTEEYYNSLSETERKEDREWSRIAARSARRLREK